MDELGKLLPRFFNKHVRGDHAPVLAVLMPLWSRVAGKAMAEQSRPVAFGNGTLTLAASSAPWATELRGLHDEIRIAVNRMLGGPLVKRVRVKLSPVASSDSRGDAVPTFAAGTEMRPGKPSLRTPEMALGTSTAIGEQAALSLEAGLDPEIREIMLRSFAKYFERANGRMN